MANSRPLPTHPVFVILLACAIYGACVVFLYHLPRKEVPVRESIRVDGTVINVIHESRSVRNSHPDSVLAIHGTDGKQYKVLVPAGVDMMFREWEKTSVGDQVSIAYEPPQRHNALPELLAMRTDRFYIDREMLRDRVRAEDQFKYDLGRIALAISLPWMGIWGWLRHRRNKLERGQPQAQSDRRDEAPPAQIPIQAEIKRTKIYRYILAAIILPLNLYGLWTMNANTLPITAICLVLFMRTMKKG
ncbi:hypothetical protein FXN63_23640 [Pigmentiphaga aceris]|uniref:DUF3592 domain-containing protein n=1 Tax=Pigmentiphaga aceris TaxID=1940612 RepID=A0A5C0B2L9_9BURK|nr:hypothetical protein [Pigmentiphaga aceris]QEI08495.1 hypothetical protein FXN63_23640 [Pigmentiphaga aceris]